MNCQPSRITSRDPLQLSGDEPKQNISEDAFGLKEMVLGVADSLGKIKTDGYVLGIEGAWGSGKSSFVNFIAEEIAKRSTDHRVIRFEPWLISGKDALLPTFLGQFAAALDELRVLDHRWWSVAAWRAKITAKRAAKTVRKYGEYLGLLATPLTGFAATDPSGTTAVVAMGLKTTGAWAKLSGSKSPSVEKLKAQIAADLKKLRKQRPTLRFIVMIDDTDRLEPAEAVEVLRLVRKVADFPSTVYLVCFDQGALGRQVAAALQTEDSPHFTEKIFQNVISLPPQEPFALRRLLRRELEQTFPGEMNREALDDVELSYRKHILFDHWVGKLTSTPRDIIRLCDAVRFGWPKVPKDGDFFDFVWLQLIKLKQRDLYSWVRRYVSNIGAYRDGGRAGDNEPKEEAKRLQAIMQTLGWADQSYRSGISYFLPGVNSYLLEGDKQKVFDFRDTDLARYERTRRLGSPSHWRHYFAFDAPSYAIRDAEMIAFRDAIRDAPDSASKFLLGLANRPHDQPGHFVDVLLSRLAEESQEALSAQERRGLAYAFAEVMDDVVASTNEVRSAGRSEIWQRAISLLSTDVAADFHRLVEKGKSVNWLAKVIRHQAAAHGMPAGHTPRPDGQWLNRDQVNRSVPILIERFKHIGARAIYRKPSPLDILFCWAQLGDANELRDFLAVSNQDDAQFLKAMDAMRGWSSSSSEGVRRPLYAHYVAYFTDPVRAKERLKRLTTSATSPELEKQARDLLGEWSDERF